MEDPDGMRRQRPNWEQLHCFDIHQSPPLGPAWWAEQPIKLLAGVRTVAPVKQRSQQSVVLSESHSL